MALREQLQLGPREVICLVGGGGKSTLLEALARDYEHAGSRVIITTTTKIMAPGHDSAECGSGRTSDRPLVLGETLPELVAALDRLHDTQPQGSGGMESLLSPVVGRTVLANGKLDGVPPEWVPALCDREGVDAVLIEADGAARLPLKAPAAYEPVIPDCTTLVIALCGLDAQWAPLDDEHVHRSALLADLMDVPVGTPLAPESLVPALVRGYQDSVPLHARLVLLFNKADVFPPDPILVETARVAPLEVWVGAVGAAEGPIIECLRPGERRPAAAVLAAGLGRRMGGRAKVTFEVGGVSLVGRAVRAALAGGAQPPIVVVAGEEHGAIRHVLERDVPLQGHGVDRWRLIRNPAPERGIGTSLALAASCANGRDLLVQIGRAHV